MPKDNRNQAALPYFDGVKGFYVFLEEPFLDCDSTGAHSLDKPVEIIARLAYWTRKCVRRFAPSRNV
jgi:hypothetical protein